MWVNGARSRFELKISFLSLMIINNMVYLGHCNGQHKCEGLLSIYIEDTKLTIICFVNNVCAMFC